MNISPPLPIIELATALLINHKSFKKIQKNSKEQKDEGTKIYYQFILKPGNNNA